jgi:GNAT superfamily N-acetyltransferase
MLIREYTTSDKAQAMHIMRCNVPLYFSEREIGELDAYLDHEREWYYVVETDGHLAGCGGINLMPDGKEARLSWDYFHPDHQGKGFGRALVQHRIKVIRQMPGINTISVRTAQRTYQFYAKNGFDWIAYAPDYWDPGYDLYHLRMKI